MQGAWQQSGEMTAGMTGKVLGSFMGKGFFRRKVDPVLGVDINDSGIKLIELGRSSGGFSAASTVSRSR